MTKRRSFLILPVARVVLTGADVFLIVAGKAGQTAELKYAPSKTGKAIVHFQVSPKFVMFGSSTFGLEFSDGLVLDFADDAAAPGRSRDVSCELAVDQNVAASPCCFARVVTQVSNCFQCRCSLLPPSIGNRSLHSGTRTDLWS